MDSGDVNEQKQPEEEIELMDSSDSEAEDEVVSEEEEDQQHREPASPVAVSVQQTAEIVPTTPFLKLLGYGTGIEVMRVRRPAITESDRSPWAIKMMCPRREQSKEEAIEARLLRHPNIVGYRGHGEINPDKKYLAVEYCNSSLGDVLEKRFEEKLGPLEQPKAMKVVLDVLAGLNYLHTEALVMHGDVKSFNVLIKDDYAVVKLCDFGVSVKVTADGRIDLAVNSDAHYVGTSLWSPPEVLEIGDEQKVITTKADMFAFGLLVFEMLVCTPPHTYAGLQDYAITTPSELISLHKKMVLTRCRLSMALSSEEPTLLDDGDEDSTEFAPKELKEAPEPAAAPKVDAEEGPIVSNVDEDVVTISDTDSEASPPGIVHELSSEDEDEYNNEERRAHKDEFDDEYDEEDSAASDDEPYDDEEGYYDDDYDEDENGYDGDYLNYGQVGTRPSIPAEVQLGPEYAELLAIFHACTEHEPTIRPSAARLLEAYRLQGEQSDLAGGEEKKVHQPDPDPEPAAPVVLDAAANAEVVELLKKELAKK
uniref:Protein kinase domain-containing protein n=1 Tax=Anopheles dirus TaxID=7168 RepID=A0A182N1D2_9DIPT